MLYSAVSMFPTRTQFKKFLGKSVKKAKHLAEEYGEKAVNKVKSVRDEGKGAQALPAFGPSVRLQDRTRTQFTKVLLHNVALCTCCCKEHKRRQSNKCSNESSSPLHLYNRTLLLTFSGRMALPEVCMHFNGFAVATAQNILSPDLVFFGAG